MNARCCGGRRRWAALLVGLLWLAACSGQGAAGGASPSSGAPTATTAPAALVALAASPATSPPVASPAAASPTPAPGGATPDAGSATPAVAYDEATLGQGGGGNNEVRIVNRVDGRLRIRGGIQLNHIPGPTVGPVNLADASSSCVDCQTIAVAMQINLIGRTAARIVPQNVAIALNERCTRCRTYAVALQYTYQVDDPRQTPPDVAALIQEMDRTLREIDTDRAITLPEAARRIDAVIAEFQGLAASLDERRAEDDRDDGGGTPVVGASPVAAPAASPAGSPAMPAATPAAAPSPSPTSTSGPSPASPTATASPPGSPVATASPSGGP